MYKAKLLLLSVMGCVVFSLVAHAHEFFYQGNITLEDGIVATGGWDTGPATLSWSVEHPSMGDLCLSSYSYTFEHPATDQVQFILEAHENMEMDAIFDVNSTLTNFEIGTFEPASYPGLPEAIYGYRFWGDTNRTLEMISFFSYYPPMWGDFYSHGTDPQDHARNGGFTAPDTGPERSDMNTSSSSLNDHVLVPGGAGLPIIPEPSSFGIAALVYMVLVIHRPGSRVALAHTCSIN